MGLSYSRKLCRLPCVLDSSSAAMRTVSSSSSPASWVTIWLHGLGDNGPNNAFIQDSFNLPSMQWHFPTAPSQSVTCNRGYVMPSWFDVEELPFTKDSPVNENALLVGVRRVHEMLDKQLERGISADRIFLCGLSQGGALTLASALLYPKQLAGAAIFSGWVPFRPAFLERASEGKKTPFLWQHGMRDSTVHFEAGQAGPSLLASHGINCEFKAYPELGHSISFEELKCLNEWFKARMAS